MGNHFGCIVVGMIIGFFLSSVFLSKLMIDPTYRPLLNLTCTQFKDGSTICKPMENSDE